MAMMTKYVWGDDNVVIVSSPSSSFDDELQVYQAKVQHEDGQMFFLVPVNRLAMPGAEELEWHGKEYWREDGDKIIWTRSAQARFNKELFSFLPPIEEQPDNGDDDIPF